MKKGKPGPKPKYASKQERQAAWNLRNKEKQQAYRREYYLKNKEKMKAKSPPNISKEEFNDLIAIVNELCSEVKQIQNQLKWGKP